MNEPEDIRDIVQRRDDSVNLWKPKVDHPLPADKDDILWSRKFIKDVASKLCKEYNLKPTDFVIRLHGRTGEEIKIKSGVIVRCYFSVSPESPNFEEKLREALRMIRNVKRSNAIETWWKLEERKKWVRDLTPNIEMDIPRDDTIVTIIYKVEIKHKKTGIVVSREGKEGTITFNKLVALAREELVDTVQLMKELKVPAKIDDFLAEQQSDELYSEIPAYDDLI